MPSRQINVLFLCSHYDGWGSRKTQLLSDDITRAEKPLQAFLNVMHLVLCELFSTIVRKDIVSAFHFRWHVQLMAGVVPVRRVAKIQDLAVDD